MTASAAYFEKRRSLFESALLDYLPREDRRPQLLIEAVRYGVLAGGKRLRPLICLAAAESLGAPVAAALPAALAIEILHNYTLVHDDLPCMDNDLLRRGQPTVHARYGEATAVLVGDALQALAFEALASHSTTPATTVAAWLGELAQAAGVFGVVGGQSEDIDSSPSDEAKIAFVHQHKTAALFRAAARLGAIAAQAAPHQVDSLGHFGNHLGLAFQIVDDLLDDPHKQPTSETPELNCLQVWSRQHAIEQARLHTTTALDSLPGHNPAATALRWLADDLLQRTF